mgnify:CR=1 FL=1
MTQLVESLKRLYEKEKISKEKLQSMIVKNTITSYEYRYIIGEA